MRCFLIIAALLVPCLAAAEPAPQPSKLVLTAVEDISVTPDQAQIALGVTTQHQRAAEAMQANAEALAKVLAALKGSGIEAKNIQTSTLSLQAQHAYAEGQAPRLTGYEARNTVSITVDDLSKLGGLLDQVTASGANSIDSLRFGLKDKTAAEDRARMKAVQSAKARAALYANEFGVKLGRILSISENTGLQPVVPYEARSVDLAQKAATPVEAGELRVTAQVTVEWEIKP